MNNQLLAISEDGTFAFIDKKRIDFEADTEMVPEPARSSWQSAESLVWLSLEREWSKHC